MSSGPLGLLHEGPAIKNSFLRKAMDMNLTKKHTVQTK